MAIRNIKIGETISAEDFESQFGNQIKIGDSISAEDFQSRFGIGEEKRSLFGSIGDTIKRRAQQFTESREREASGEQTGIETGLQLAGQTLGGAFDIAGSIIGAGVRTLTPKFIEDPAVEIGRKIIAKIVEGEAVSDSIREYQIFKEKNPRAASNIESVLNIVSIFPFAKAKPTGLATQIKKAPIKEVGQIFIKSGEKTVLAKKREFVRNLVRPLQTAKIKDLQVARTTETGRGIFKKSIIKPSAQELSMENIIVNIAKVSSKKTIQGNYNIIAKENIRRAKSLIQELKNNDFIFPNKELLAKLNQAKQRLANNPAIVGDAEKTAAKLIAEIERRVKKAPNKGSALLQVRKDFDAWVTRQKGPKVFSPDRESAFSLAIREIRQTLNKFLDDKAVTVSVKESLKDQNSLFNALKNIERKAGVEADTAFLRAFQKMGTVLNTKSRIVQGIGASIGLAGFGAAAAFAPAVAVTGAIGILIFSAGKLILNPRLRIGIGKAIQFIDSQLNILTSPIEKAALIEFRNFLVEQLKEE